MSPRDPWRWSHAPRHHKHSTYDCRPHLSLCPQIPHAPQVWQTTRDDSECRDQNQQNAQNGGFRRQKPFTIIFTLWVERQIREALGGQGCNWTKHKIYILKPILLCCRWTLAVRTSFGIRVWYRQKLNDLSAGGPLWFTCCCVQSDLVYPNSLAPIKMCSDCETCGLLNHRK